MRHIKKALSYSIAGALGLGIVASLQGCGNPAPPQGGSVQQADAQNQNFFLVLQQTGTNPDTYKLLEKHPTDGPTRAILKLPDGTERFLSDQELKKVAEEEAKKVEAGTSRLTQEPSAHSGGLSLGETLLAAAAGSLIGGMLANALMGNKNYQRTQQQYGGGRPTASISRPAPNKAAAPASTKPKSGFFGGSNAGKKSSSSSFGGMGG